MSYDEIELYMGLALGPSKRDLDSKPSTLKPEPTFMLGRYFPENVCETTGAQPLRPRPLHRRHCPGVLGFRGQFGR